MRKSRRAVLHDALSAWKGRKVVILGDMILDEFIYGRTNRVSREAPVVIVRYDGTGHSPGGAANAAQNIASMGGRAVPVGIAARDDGGKALREYFRSRKIPVGGLMSIPGTPTTTKTRLMAGDFHAQRQQIVRIDREGDKVISRKHADRLFSIFESKLEGAEAVILSDYDQGVFSSGMIRRAVRSCRKAGIPVVADSRFRIGFFKGVTTATPNEVEAAEAVGVGLAGEKELKVTGKRLLDTIGSESLLVTRGRFGMSLFKRGGRREDVGVAGSPEATDVTGAGDTVVAAVALSLAAGHDMKTAMVLANMAASVVVMKRGTAVADPEEISSVIDSEGP